MKYIHRNRIYIRYILCHQTVANCDAQLITAAEEQSVDMVRLSIPAMKQ